MKFFDYGETAFGIIAVGNNAAGVIAVGNTAFGIFAFSSLFSYGIFSVSWICSIGFFSVSLFGASSGVFSFGSFSFGVVTIGYLGSLGIYRSILGAVSISGIGKESDGPYDIKFPTRENGTYRFFIFPHYRLKDKFNTANNIRLGILFFLWLIWWIILNYAGTHPIFFRN